MDLTLDRAASVLVDEQIGRTRYLTPEGFLFCEGVRIARTGPMIYRADEVPDIAPGGPGMITVERDADVLFDESAMASFNGKPVTNDHPPSFVLPGTWKAYSVGTVLNPRRGEGVEADYLIADLLITDQQAIDDVQAGKREVSCGYSADREQVKPGLGRQTKIVGNHVALVQRGRAGPACAIQDSDPVQPKEITMPKRSAWDRLRTAFKAQDEAAFEEEMKEAQKDTDEEGGPQQLVIHVKGVEPEKTEAKAEEPAKDEGDPLADIKAMLEAFGARLSKLEAGEVGEEQVADEDPEDKKDEEKKEDKEATMDSASLRSVFDDVRSRAEILFPGINLPSFDAKAVRKTTNAAMHDLRIRALQSAYADPARKSYVADALGGREPKFDTMTADAAEVVFNAACAIAKAANKSSGKVAPSFPQGPMTASKYAELIKSRRSGK